MLRIQLILRLIIVVGTCIDDATHVVVFVVEAREDAGDAVCACAEELFSMAARINAIIHQELHDDVNPDVVAVGDVLCCPMIPIAIPVHSCVG